MYTSALTQTQFVDHAMPLSTCDQPELPPSLKPLNLLPSIVKREEQQNQGSDKHKHKLLRGTGYAHLFELIRTLPLWCEQLLHVT